jgi:hypothetical protein
MGTAAEPVDIAAESVDIAVEPMDYIARPVDSAVAVASSGLKMGTFVIARLLEVTWCTQLLTDSIDMQLAGSTVGEGPIVVVHTIGSMAAIVAIRQQAGVTAEELVVVVAVSEQASTGWRISCLGFWLAPMGH